MKITKASGLFEDFNEQKLLGSIKSAGVSEDIGQKAVQLVKTKLSPRTDTHQISPINLFKTETISDRVIL